MQRAYNWLASGAAPGKTTTLTLKEVEKLNLNAKDIIKTDVNKRSWGE